MIEQASSQENLSATSESVVTPKGASGETTMRLGLAKTVIALLFFLLFAYDVWEVIESTLEFNQYLSLQLVHWSILIALMVAPVLIWVLSVLVARKLSALKFALVLLVGWAVSAQIFLTLNYLLQLLFLGLLS